MGKPFKNELEKIDETYQWALKVVITNLNEVTDFLFTKPIYVVGSGGSSSACAYMTLLHNSRGLIATAITPLELQYIKKAINKASNIVFISASGRNSDILFAFDTAIKEEPKNILNICLKEDSPLKKKSDNYSISTTIEFENPAGKDGFLATNSLIAYFAILSRIYGFDSKINSLAIKDSYLFEIQSFCSSLHEDFTIIVLYGGWGKPVAIDIESKCSEAGLGNILFADYRNFGHGRHNWFDKKPKQSAIIALISEEEKELANKTLELLPNTIPVLKISTEYYESDASIDLLNKSFHLVKEIGRIKSIDPGRPGVPDYGSKLYHLRYSKYYAEKSQISDKVKIAINRKFGNIDLIQNKNILPLWIGAYNTFIKKMNSSKFHGILLDYDGTLCSSEERLTLPREAIIEELLRFLENGIKIGIITGRGKSVRENMQKLIPQKYWESFVIGYYNGAQIGLLNDNKLPEIKSINPLFLEIEKTLNEELLISNFVKSDLREGQLTIIVNEKINSKIVKNTLIDFLRNRYGYQIQILESSHSIDVISNQTSKSLIIDYYRNLLNDEHSKLNFLCIGDMGKFPGNDYQLLANEFSLSVDQVSNDPYNCWNLASIGKNCVEATIEYFNAVKICDAYFKIKL